MTPYAATTTTPLESPQPLSSDSSGSGAKHSRTERSQTRRNNRSQRNDGEAESSDPESQETGLVEGGGEHPALVSRPGVGELKVGDRVRIVEAPRNVGKLATITENNPDACYGRDLLVLPDGDRMVMSIFASGVEFVERPEAISSEEAGPTQEPEEQAAPKLELKVGDR